MKNHTLDFDNPYPGLDKIQTLIWMKNHTLDFDDNPYPGLDKIQTLIFDETLYSRFGWKIIL